MENNNRKDDSYDSILAEEEEIQLYKGLMHQKIGKKNIVLSNEISKKKKIINRLFRERFGKNFIPIKLESLKAFESFIKFFLFSPQSKILSKFPKLKKQILNEKDIDYNTLNDKINMGSLLYLSLSGSGTALNRNVNQKFFQISKNLTTTVSKDTISNQVYNVKFLKKNAERINKILSYKEKENKDKKEIETLKNDNVYLNKSNIKNIKSKSSNYKGRNLSSEHFQKQLSSINNKSYKTYENFYLNSTNSNTINYNNNNYLTFNKFNSYAKDNSIPILKMKKNSLKFLSKGKNQNLKLNKFSFNSVAKHNSRNIISNLAKLEGLTTANISNYNNEHSEKAFSPFSTFTNFHNKNSIKIYKQAKNYQIDIHKYVQNLNNQTDNCNKKLIRLININKKIKLKTNEEENQEVIDLKNILLDKKHAKKKNKINNIKQIKILIKKAKLDSEGEANLDKIKRKELKQLGHYLNIWNNEFALGKVGELYTKAQLKIQGKNFAQEELNRLRKKKIREVKVFRSRKNAKINYLKMIKMKNNLILIKDKFDKVDIETANRTIEINNKQKRNISTNI